MNCISYTCYAKLKEPPPLQNIHAVSVHSVIDHDLYPMDLVHCNDMIGNAQFMHTLIKCRNLQKEILIGLDVQQLHHLNCDWRESDHMFLHQGVYVISNSTDIVMDELHL